MKSFLTTIDIFGEPVKVYLNQTDVVRTAFGGVLTLSMLSIILILSWFIGNDLILRRCPYTSQQKVITNDYPPIHINESTFPFSVVLTDFNNVPMFNSSMIQLKLYYVVTYINSSGQIQTDNLEIVELEQCRMDHFPPLTAEQFNSANLNSNLCLKKQNYTLEGFWGYKTIQYVNLAAEMCDYDTQPDICAKPEEIEEFVSSNGLAFNIYYLDGAFDSKNYSHPLKTYVGNFYKYIDSGKYKVAEYFLDYDSIITDSGIIFEEPQTLNYFKLREMHLDYLDFNRETKQLLSFIIYASNVSNKNYRKYIKVAEILASIGGLYKVFHLIFTYGNLGISRVKKFEIVIDEIFDFYFDTKLETKKSQSIKIEKSILHFPVFTHCANKEDLSNSRPSEFQKINFSRRVRNIEISQENYNKIYLKLNKHSDKEKLNLKIRDNLTILLRPICKKKKLSPKLEIYFKGENKIKEYFDFINIIKKLEEFEDMKNIIFNKNQKLLFQLYVNSNKDENTLSRKFIPMSKTKTQIVAQSIREFLNRFTQQTNSKLDNRLLALLLE